jgi:hypothetical protein
VIIIKEFEIIEIGVEEGADLGSWNQRFTTSQYDVIRGNSFIV